MQKCPQTFTDIGDNLMPMVVFNMSTHFVMFNLEHNKGLLYALIIHLSQVLLGAH